MIYRLLGDEEKASMHAALHERYRPGDNAHDRAVTMEVRHNPAADHAAEAVVVYDLQRSGACQLPLEQGMPAIAGQALRPLAARGTP